MRRVEHRRGEEKNQMSAALKPLSACLRIIFKYDMQCWLKCFFSADYIILYQLWWVLVRQTILLHHWCQPETLSQNTSFTQSVHLNNLLKTNFIWKTLSLQDHLRLAYAVDCELGKYEDDAGKGEERERVNCDISGQIWPVLCDRIQGGSKSAS